MYWSRTGSYVDLLAWGLFSLVSWAGGWLLCAHLFRLRSRERLFAGVASGTLLSLLFSNLLAQVLPLVTAYWLAAALVLILGILAAWRDGGFGHRNAQRPWVGRLALQELLVWPQILAFGVLFLLFLGINRGLAIFDDYTNLPLVSMIATGDVPPHFYLDPTKILDYHYGVHLLAASLVRIGGFFPWSALDLYKAFSIALTVILGVLWYRRYMAGGAAWLWAGLFVLFAGGSRWLLLFIPEATLAHMSVGIQLEGSAMQTADTLYAALLSPWRIAGDGPIPFPLAFVSGISRPLSLALGGNSAMPVATLFLLLLLARRDWKPAQGLAYGLLLVSLALISDHLFAILLAGLVLAALLRWFSTRSFAQVRQWLWPVLPGLLLAPVMGGVLTSLVQRLASGSSGIASGGAAAARGLALPGIAFRWPPAIFSAHFGALSLTEPSQLLVALIEMGPILLLAPWVILAARSYIRSGKLVMAGLSLMAVVSFLAPLFVRFVERERDITRLTGTALTIWMVLGFPYAWLAFRRAGKLARLGIGAGYTIAILGGIALLPVQLVAMAQTQPSYFVQSPDAAMSRAYWDKLDEKAWVLDPAFPYRPPTLFGRTTGPAYIDAYISLADFDALVARLDPLEIVRAGYSYIYLDRESWQNLTTEQKQAFQQHCVKQLAEQKDRLGDFRRLFDIRSCLKAP